MSTPATAAATTPAASPKSSREVRLRSRPAGVPTPDNFSFATVDLLPPGPGEVQVRNTCMSVDPYMRGRMEDRPSYVPPFQIGKPLDGAAVGEVLLSNDDRFKPGDQVFSIFGWREAFNAPAAAVRPIDTSLLPANAYLGVAGVTGLTAYVGLLHIAKIKAGEVLFVSAAAGATGSTVCQIAKAVGATVIGSAGGEAKCRYLREIGVDRTIDYKAIPKLTAALAEAAPKGIDVYFDNVGGEHLEAALAIAKNYARFALCGMIAGYNDHIPGPSNLANAVGKRLTLQGFIVSDHFDLLPRFIADIGGWIQSGKLTWRETIVEGLDQAPTAFANLFRGENIGKMLVRL